MIGPAGYRSCLARAQPHTAPSDEDLLAMHRRRGARRAWSCSGQTTSATTGPARR
jgi:hypothetical protein